MIFKRYECYRCEEIFVIHGTSDVVYCPYCGGDSNELDHTNDVDFIEPDGNIDETDKH